MTNFSRYSYSFKGSISRNKVGYLPTMLHHFSALVLGLLYNFHIVLVICSRKLNLNFKSSGYGVAVF